MSDGWRPARSASRSDAGGESASLQGEELKLPGVRSIAWLVTGDGGFDLLEDAFEAGLGMVVARGAGVGGDPLTGFAPGTERGRRGVISPGRPWS